MGRFYGIKGKDLLRHYRHIQGEFNQWDQKPHAAQWLLYAHNLGQHLSIDETSLSHGELYTILTEKAANSQPDRTDFYDSTNGERKVFVIISIFPNAAVPRRDENTQDNLVTDVIKY